MIIAPSRLLRPMVKLDVIERRSVPAPVLLHDALLQPLEPLPVVVPRVDCPIHGIIQRPWVGSLKVEERDEGGRSALAVRP